MRDAVAREGKERGRSPGRGTRGGAIFSLENLRNCKVAACRGRGATAILCRWHFSPSIYPRSRSDRYPFAADVLTGARMVLLVKFC